MDTGRSATCGRGRWKRWRGANALPPRPGRSWYIRPSLPYAEYATVPGVHEWIVFDCSVTPGLDLFRLHPVSPVVPLRDPAGFSACL